MGSFRRGASVFQVIRSTDIGSLAGNVSATASSMSCSWRAARSSSGLRSPGAHSGARSAFASRALEVSIGSGRVSSSRFRTTILRANAVSCVARSAIIFFARLSVVKKTPSAGRQACVSVVQACEGRAAAWEELHRMIPMNVTDDALMQPSPAGDCAWRR